MTLYISSSSHQIAFLFLYYRVIKSVPLLPLKLLLPWGFSPESYNNNVSYPGEIATEILETFQLQVVVKTVDTYSKLNGRWVHGEVCYFVGIRIIKQTGDKISHTSWLTAGWVH